MAGSALPSRVADRAGASLRRLDRGLDDLVEQTKDSRDRMVDLVRAFAICVVVVWHWALSVTHWADGELVMPNPVADVPGGWAATWLLQVMPLFFFVGGFAHLAAWQSVRRAGGGAGQFYRRRLRRLLPPVAVFVVAWVLVDVGGRVLVPGYRSVLEWGLVTFIPLWFLAAYVWVLVLVPATARLHERRPLAGLVALGAAVAVADAGRFVLGVEAFGWANTALVWVFVHQLGFFYRDGTLTDAPDRARLALAGGGLAGIVLLTGLPAYPRSMVAVEGAEVSHMYPTTAGIAVLAIFQAGVALLARPHLLSWLRRRRVWKTVVTVNAVVMTVFLWHMTALVAAIGVFELFGGRLLADPTVAWWVQRPLWLVLPAVLLVPLVAVFSRFETGPLRP